MSRSKSEFSHSITTLRRHDHLEHRIPNSWINPARTHVTFSFREGVNFIDKYGLLKGSGKTDRGVQLNSIESVNQEALRDDIGQAVETGLGSTRLLTRGT